MWRWGGAMCWVRENDQNVFYENIFFNKNNDGKNTHVYSYAYVDSGDQTQLC